MSGDFESTPHDGSHPWTDPGNDWRSGNGIGDKLKRFVSYGNWAGPGNRMDTENADYIEQQRAANPAYDPYHDPTLMNDPRYRAIDGVDAAARSHDHGYGQHLSGDGGLLEMFTWDGMRRVREDDRELTRATQQEMDVNGAAYSPEATRYTQGLRGFFGTRAMGMDAADWAGGKAGEAGQGISNFVQGARDWNSMGDAARGIGQGISNAGSWAANTAGEAWQGVKGYGQYIGSLGWPGAVGAAGGLLNLGVAGAAKGAGMLWDGAKGAASSVWNGARDLAGSAASGVRSAAGTVWNGAKSAASTAWDGAKSVGSTVANGVSSAASWAGNHIASGASAVANTAQRAGSAIASGAQRAGSAVAGGARRAWNWMTGG